MLPINFFSAFCGHYENLQSVCLSIKVDRRLNPCCMVIIFIFCSILSTCPMLVQNFMIVWIVIAFLNFVFFHTTINVLFFSTFRYAAVFRTQDEFFTNSISRTSFSFCMICFCRSTFVASGSWTNITGFLDFFFLCI